MKKRFIFALAVALIISSIHVFGQEKVVSDSTKTTIEKSELVKKFEAEKKTLIEQCNKRLFDLALNDPASYNRMVQLATADPEYSKLTAKVEKLEELLREFKPKEIKKENK